MSIQQPLRPVAVVVLVTLVTFVTLGALAPACTSSPSTPTSPSATVAAPSATGYKIVPDVEVASGLAKVRTLAAEVKVLLATSQPDAEAKAKVVYDVWFTFEGTIRKNDKNLYLQMEDGLGAIKNGAQLNQPDKVGKGIEDLESAATAYLKAHP